MAHIALCTSLYNPDWLKALCWMTEQRGTNAGERSPPRAGYTRQTDLQCQTHWHVIQKQGQCQPATGMRTRSYWPHEVRDVMEKEERGHVAAGTAAAPEMTGGDLLNAGFELGFCIFCNEFQCLVKQEVSLHPSDTTWRHLRRGNKFSYLVSLVTAPGPLCNDSWYCIKAS